MKDNDTLTQQHQKNQSELQQLREVHKSEKEKTGKLAKVCKTLKAKYDEKEARLNKYRRKCAFLLTQKRDSDQDEQQQQGKDIEEMFQEVSRLTELLNEMKVQNESLKTKLRKKQQGALTNVLAIQGSEKENIPNIDNSDYGGLKASLKNYEFRLDALTKENQKLGFAKANDLKQRLSLEKKMQVLVDENRALKSLNNKLELNCENLRAKIEKEMMSIRKFPQESAGGKLEPVTQDCKVVESNEASKVEQVISSEGQAECKQQ